VLGVLKESRKKNDNKFLPEVCYKRKSHGCFTELFLFSVGSKKSRSTKTCDHVVEKKGSGGGF
jgi:hypothetical protein